LAVVVASTTAMVSMVDQVADLVTTMALLGWAAPAQMDLAQE
jgi:hypothetical protein